MTKQELDKARELGKEDIGWNRHVKLLGKDSANGTLYHWMRGYEIASKRSKIALPQNNEENLLKLLKVQSNLTVNHFRDLFGEDRADRLFHLYSRNNWNLLHFLFNNVNGKDREALLKFIENWDSH